MRTYGEERACTLAQAGHEHGEVIVLLLKMPGHFEGGVGIATLSYENQCGVSMALRNTHAINAGMILLSANRAVIEEYVLI